MSECDIGVPDLLRRFVEAPYSVRTEVGGIAVELQTNDREIISRVQRSTQDELFQSASWLRVRVIRDSSARDEVEDSVLLHAGPVTTMFVGMDTVLAMDSDRSEVVGFVAVNISAERLIEELLPQLLREGLRGRMGHTMDARA